MGKKEIKKLKKELLSLKEQEKSTLVTPKKAKKVNFFKFPSLEPNKINSYEINQLLKNQDLDKVNARLRSQARSISTSISLTAGFLELLNSEIYGESGFILDITTKNRKLNQYIQDAFFDWENNCCVDDVFDFSDFEELTLTALFRDGESFLYLHKNEDGLKLEFIDAEEIDDNYNEEGKNIFNGIAFKKGSKKPIAYYRKVKNDKIQVIPAENILHIKRFKTANQKRGITNLAPAILDTHSKDKLKKAELDRTRLDSEITGFFVRKNDGVSYDNDIEFDENGEPVQGEVEIPSVAEVGKIAFIDDDITPHLIPSRNPINLEYLLKSTDRDIARSLGISYSTYTGDLSEVNYSSIRQGTTQERRYFSRIQNFIRRKFHDKIFKEWLYIKLLNQDITPAEYKEVLAHFTFKAQGWEYIDPSKEVKANEVAINAGFKTRTEVLRQKGIEVDAFLDDLEKDKLIMQKLKQIKKETENVKTSN